MLLEALDSCLRRGSHWITTPEEAGIGSKETEAANKEVRIDSKETEAANKEVRNFKQ